MAEPLPGFEQLLTQATGAVFLGGQVKGTAWLLDNRHLMTAGHILGKTDPVDEVEVRFMDDPAPHKATRVDSQYNRDRGIDCCVLELTEALVGRQPLPISLSGTARGTFHIYGFGTTLVDLSSATGTFVGPYHPQNLTANRLFELETQQAREQGYSGGAIFSDDTRSVVAIQIEGTTVPGSAAHGNTVLAMPMYRIAELFQGIRIFREALNNIPENSYQYDVYLSYDRGGAEELWLNRHFRDQLKIWLKLELGKEPSIFWDHDAHRNTWDAIVAEAIRRSRCLVPVLTFPYWKSPQCLAELQSFRERQRNEKVALTLGVLFHEKGEPSTSALAYLNFVPHARTYSGFERSETYGLFQHDVQDFAKQLASLISNAPPAYENWPVVSPAEVTPPTGSTQVQIPRPRL